VSAPARSPSRWLYGPWPDLLLGCCLGYVAIFAVLCVYGPQVRDQTTALLPFLTLVIGAPHYGATLLRVYERREDRRAYAFFTVYVTALLVATFAVATRVVMLGSLLLTLYLTWSPWHYAGQNYGLALMFLRRRGIAVEPALKRCIYLSFVLSYAMTFTAMHTEKGGASYAPTLYDGYHMLALGIPGAAASVAIPAFGVAYLGALALAAWRLLQRAPPRDLVPSALLVFAQALWFSIPVATRTWGLLQGVEPLASQYSTYYFFWAALGHSVQYVWVASYYARSAPGFGRLGRYLWKALLAGTALWTVPPLLFAPRLLGRIPFDAGLAALVASVVNLHHFILDGAIWKLRDGRIARVLIRSEPALPPTAPPAAPTWRWLAPTLWTVGAASLGVVLFAYYQQEMGRLAWRDGDLARLRTTSRRLRWIGRESANVDLQLGRLLASSGDRNGALASYRQSLAIQPTAEAWAATADALEEAGQLDAAQDAVGHAVDLAPDRAAIVYRAGSLALKRGALATARALLERAVSLDPDRKLYRLMLERAQPAASN
jgi:hypothetical protein